MRCARARNTGSHALRGLLSALADTPIGRQHPRQLARSSRRCVLLEIRSGELHAREEIVKPSTPDRLPIRSAQIKEKGQLLEKWLKQCGHLLNRRTRCVSRASQISGECTYELVLVTAKTRLVHRMEDDVHQEPDRLIECVRGDEADTVAVERMRDPAVMTVESFDFGLRKANSVERWYTRCQQA